VPARDSEWRRAPDLLRRLDDELQRAPLVVPHHQMAGVGQCEATLQADRQVLERVSCPACAPCDSKQVCGGLQPLSFPNSGHAHTATGVAHARSRRTALRLETRITPGLTASRAAASGNPGSTSSLPMGCRPRVVRLPASFACWLRWIGSPAKWLASAVRRRS
jgi:hypothetical protein